MSVARVRARHAFGRSIAALALLVGCTTRPASEDPGAAAAAVLPLPGASSTEASEPAPSASVALRQASVAELHVPHAQTRIVPTGHFDVHAWGGAAHTGTFLDRAGVGAVPISEARLLWGDGSLYVFFYAGDLDLQAHASKHDEAVWNDDSVALTFRAPDGAKRIIQISVRGVVADGICPEDAVGLSDPRCDRRWESGVRVGTDSEGTFNRIGDRDEEWAVEAAIPLAAVGLSSPTAGTRIPFAIGRCEVAYDGPRACGAWGDGPAGGVLVLEGP